MFISIIKSSLQKAQVILHQVTAQMVFVFIAFAIMVITTYIFVSDIERKHLKQEAEDTVAYTQANITANLLEPEAALSTIAETIRGMIIRDYTFDEVSEYITHITDYILTNDRLVADATGVYGVFDVFGGKFWTGIDWEPPDDYMPVDRPWYSAAVEANGEVGLTEPYLDVSLGVIAITYSRRIFDDEGRPLGVICLDVLLDRIRRAAIDTRIASGSYGILTNRHFEVIAHPSRAYWGRSLRDMNDGPAIEQELREKGELSERKVIDYRGDLAIAYIRRLDNGWFLGILAPERAYYQSVKKIALLLSGIGFMMAIALNIVLIRIAAAKSKADTESRQKTNFLATMSHEIRTPMNAILGITEIQMQNRSLPQDTGEALTKIHNSGYLLLGIINDILDLSKIEAGKLELAPIKYDVASLIHDTAQLNMMRIGSKRIKFDLQIDPFTPAELIGDELRIKQILNNLLSNAFKYTESGEVVLSVNAKYEDRVKNPYVNLIIRVSDTGQGMSADQVNKLFDEYSRFNLEANRMTEGAGLGMSITKKLVQMMDGHISVESDPGKGSIFTVHLPQGNAGAPPLGGEMAENLRQFRLNSMSQMKTVQLVREPMPYGSVLIVDDVETNLYVAKGLLSPYGLKIDTAISGFEAIEKTKTGNVYDIVFMDHMMPKMDGIEATKLMRESGYTHPIVALTANAVAGQAGAFLSNGFDDFISKPIDIRELNAALNKLIRDKQPPEVVEAARKNALENLAADRGTSISQELAGIFIRDAQKAINALKTIHEKQDAPNDGDIQLFTITVHAMKTALANIGEEEASHCAKKLEAAGREKDIAVILNDTPAFLNDLQVIIKKITPIDDDDDKTIVEDTALLQEKLLLFRAACTVYDKKAAKEVIIELKKKKWSYPTKEMLNTLTEHLLHSDFEEAATIARDYEFS